MDDHSSRPHRSPRRTAAKVVEQVTALRAERDWEPARIGPRLGLPVPTVARILRRKGIPRLCDVDLAYGNDCAARSAATSTLHQETW